VFLVSGGEDGSLRIYETDSGAPASVLQAHLSSVKTLLRSKSLLLSAGGRAQLILWKLQFSNGNCKSLKSTQISASDSQSLGILKQLHNHMLLDGDKPVKVPWRESYLNPRPDPETRYMALCVLSHVGTDLIFLAACSDSLLRYTTINIFLMFF
jgi:WD40 repeat protein